MKVLIVGCGDLGISLGNQLLPAHQVWGLRRDPSRLPEGFQGIAGDVSQTLPDLPQVDAVVYCVAAKSFDETIYRQVYLEGMQRLLAALHPQRATLKRLLFTSSTSVFQENDGAWVNESTAAAPTSFSGTIQLETEQLVAASGFMASSARLGGIYGPGRYFLMESAYRSTGPANDPPLYSNRIHRDDAAAVLKHLLTLETPQPLYVATDGQAAPMHEVYAWIRERMRSQGIEPHSDGTPSKEPRRANKRCDNRRLLDSGFKFAYPDYQSGYAPLVDAWVKAKQESTDCPS